MNDYLNFNVISELIKIAEKILSCMYNLSKIHDVSDYYRYEALINDIKLFYKKEKYLIAQIPKNNEVYNYILDLLGDENNFKFDDDKNSKVILARIYGLIHFLYLDLFLKLDISEDDEKYYEILNMYNRSFIRENLLCEYISSLNDSVRISNDRKVVQFFYNIQLYNIFINARMFDLWVAGGFDFDNICYYSDEKAMKILDLSSDDYDYLKDDVVIDCISSLLPEIFTTSKYPKRNVLVQDSFFNFKFLLSKISDDKLLQIKRKLDDTYFEIGKHGLVEDVIASIYSELASRSLSVDEKENQSSKYYDMSNYDLFVSLIKLEDKIYEVFTQFSFYKCDKGIIDQLLFLVNEEQRLISSIDFMSIISVVNDTLNNNLWFYLSGDEVSYKASLIHMRLTNLIPFFRQACYSPIHNSLDFEYVHRNHLVRSLSAFRTSSAFMDDGVIGAGSKEFYKFFYFINPDLFEELLLCDGNDLFMYDIGDDIIEQSHLIDTAEYQFDKNEYLYNIGESIISDLFDKENNIISISDYVNLVFNFVRLDDVIDNLNISYIRKLYKYLNTNTSFFSSLRRDLRKLFRARFSSEKVKVKKVIENKNG